MEDNKNLEMPESIREEEAKTPSARLVEETEDTVVSQKKPHKKFWIIVGVIVAVIIALGAAFMVWHEQPSFCNAICHSPMDTYVEQYSSGNDKYLLTAHAEAGEACLDCHEPVLSDQISEGIAWITGDYDDPMKASRIGTKAFCFTCHNDGNVSDGMDYDAIIAATENYGGSGRNPHSSHLGVLDCYTCHSVHSTSTLYCRTCHTNIPLPANWK